MRVKIPINIKKLKLIKSSFIIQSLILSGKLDIYDVPKYLRTSESMYYIYTFRRLREIRNKEKHKSTLDLLVSDISSIIDKNHEWFLKDLFDYGVKLYEEIYLTVYQQKRI